jgi:hypothetical protein
MSETEQHSAGVCPRPANPPAGIVTGTPSPHSGPQVETLFACFSHPQAPVYERVEADQVPEPYRHLLVHEHHMTVTVEAHHGSRVKLRVLERLQRDNWYARKILLLLEGNERVVQFGIMRFNFDYCDAEVRDEILRGATPLGRILIEHDVLRRIEPTAFLLVVPHKPMMESFELDRPQPTYGRLAYIHCNHQPAVELLEIVAPEPP